MREEATLSATVAAPPQLCFDVASDIAAYPVWADDIKEADVLEYDTDGRPALVRFRAAAMGRSTTYTLRYDYSSAPTGLSWKQTEGDVTGVLEGSWEFAAADGDNASVRYQLTVELAMPLPGFVKRRAEARIVHTALGDFADRVEALAAGDG